VQLPQRCRPISTSQLPHISWQFLTESPSTNFRRSHSPETAASVQTATSSPEQPPNSTADQAVAAGKLVSAASDSVTSPEATSVVPRPVPSAKTQPTVNPSIPAVQLASMAMQTVVQSVSFSVPSGSIISSRPLSSPHQTTVSAKPISRPVVEVQQSSALNRQSPLPLEQGPQLNGTVLPAVSIVVASNPTTKSINQPYTLITRQPNSPQSRISGVHTSDSTTYTATDTVEVINPANLTFKHRLVPSKSRIRVVHVSDSTTYTATETVEVTNPANPTITRKPNFANPRIRVVHVSDGITYTTTETVAIDHPSPTEDATLDRPKTFRLKTKVRYGVSKFDNLTIQNPIDRKSIIDSTPRDASN
jgi:hypothetical protein